jgi:hypothetical protein
MTLDKLRHVLSKERLVSYGENENNAEIIIKKYNENVLLCEAMYPALHYFEVLLRNHMNFTIGKLYNEGWLLKIPPHLQLSNKDILKINEIKDQFFKEKKKVATHSDVVSRLSFGFWCALFHKRFDPVLWHRKNALRSIFPNMKRENQTRRYVESKILKIKKIRNRIAHHERIWGNNKDTYQVYAAYNDCVGLIQAMSYESLNLLKMSDRFLKVYKKIISDNSTVKLTL